MSIAAKSVTRVAGLGRDGDWLSARAEEIVQQNPGGPFPESDREFVDQTFCLIRQNVVARVRGQSYSLFNSDDLAQICWVRAVQFFPQFRGKGFRTWIYRIVQTVFCSMLKTNRHSAATSIEEMVSGQNRDGQSSEDVFIDDVDFTEEVDGTKLINDFLAWLRRRNPKHAKIVELDLAGWERHEIAERVGVGYRAVSSVLTRAPHDYHRFLEGGRKEKLEQTRRTDARNH